MPNLTPFLARSLATGTPPVVWVIAEFDCEGEAADELSFRAGDQIQLKRRGRRVVAQSCDGVHHYTRCSSDSWGKREQGIVWELSTGSSEHQRV